MKLVTAYRKAGSSSRNKGNLYLRVDCLDWLLSYAADELHFQGVTQPESDTELPKANCPAVADLHLEWHFGERAWHGQLASGELAGTRRCVGEADITKDRWCKLIQLSLVEGELSMAKQKTAAKQLITMWFSAIKRNEGARFETDWDLQTGIAQPLEKKRRATASPSSAVADEGITPV